MTATADPIVYVDSSALVKLVLLEPESVAAGALVLAAPAVATSRVALVEVARAVFRADPGSDALADAEGVLAPFFLVDVDAGVLRQAAALTGGLRSLDAIHLASALTVGAEAMLVYDIRLASAVEAAGLRVIAPS
ncbi:MAG: type II toxin-antitoxin system VapC family toxin [Gaiellaceae bacterium]